MTTEPSPDAIERTFLATNQDAYRLNVQANRTDTATAEWNLTSIVTSPDETPTDRTDELLRHLEPDADEVIDAIEEHTDFRTTIDGSNLGWVLVDTDTGEITGYKLVEAYPGEPTVKINHDQLESDLRELNSQ